VSAVIAAPPYITIPDRARRTTPAVVLSFPPVAAPPDESGPDPASDDLAVAAGQLRLTRRGRAVALVAALACLAGGLWLAHLSAPASVPPQHGAPRTVMVSGHDTLWSIAARIAPERDPRVVVAELERRNDLPDATIRAGQQLLTP
jgi:LysM domain